MNQISLAGFQELTALFDGSISITLGSSDARRRPHFLRAMAVRLGGEPDLLEVVVTQSAAQQLLADVKENPKLACAVVNVDNYESRQFVGVFEGASVSLEADLLRAESTREKAADSFRRFFGHSAADGFLRYATRPALSIRIRVEAVFNQTPGAQAGARLA